MWQGFFPGSMSTRKINKKIFSGIPCLTQFFILTLKYKVLFDERRQDKYKPGEDYMGNRKTADIFLYLHFVSQSTLGNI